MAREYLPLSTSRLVVGTVDGGLSDGEVVVLCVEFVAMLATSCVVLDGRHEDGDGTSVFPFSELRGGIVRLRITSQLSTNVFCSRREDGRSVSISLRTTTCAMRATMELN